ncbi:MAG: M23 family metallopeptidase [Kineosporiaceae bacterium]|nr:M23 family metallopeptidase [Kineosporiaceae bacterium]
MAVRRFLIAVGVCTAVLGWAFPDGAAALVPDAPSGGPAVVVDRGPTAAAPSPRPDAAEPVIPGRAWSWPLTPPHPVLARFAPGPQRWSPGHRGVDLGATAGAALLAPSDGVVSFAGAVAGRGVLVISHPNGVRTTYEPVAALVGVGHPVRSGQIVGRVLATGSHCAQATCLHWGALRGQTYLDPLSLLGLRPPPVLLPLLPLVPVGVRTAVAAPASPGQPASASLARSCITALVCI